MRLSYKKPAKCVKDSPEQQHANTHLLFIKLCWLMDKHAVRSDRVVNIDETSCRLLPGASDRVGPLRQTGPAAGQHARGHDIHGRFQHGPWPAGHAGADRARGQDRRRLAGAALAGAHSPRHVRERLGHHDDAPAAHSHIGQRAEPEQRRTSVDPSLGHGQHPRQRGHPGRHAFRRSLTSCCASSRHEARRTCSPATWPSSAASRAASRRRRAPLLPSPSSTALRMLGRQVAMAAKRGECRALTDLCDQNQVWTTGVACAPTATTEFFQALKRPTSCTLLFARAHRAGARSRRPRGMGHGRGVRRRRRRARCQTCLSWLTGPPMSSLERCIALRLVHGAGPRQRLQKNATCTHISASLSVVSRVGCLVCPGPHPCFHVLTTSPKHPDSGKPFFLCAMASKSVGTRVP